MEFLMKQSELGTLDVCDIGVYYTLIYFLFSML